MIDDIYQFVNLHYNEFCRQSNVKLDRKYKEDKSAAQDLVHSVLYSMFEKMSNDEQFLLKLHDMLKKDRLFLYIIKSIDINSKFPTGPYLRHKFRHCRHKELDGNIQLEDEEVEEKDSDDELLDFLQENITLEKFESMFGKSGYFYYNVVKMYEKPKSTYKSIAEHYNISKSSVAAAVITVKARLREDALEKIISN